MKKKREGKKIKDTKLTAFQQEILDTTTEALNQLHIGDLDALSKTQLVRVVKALITLEKQCNNQIQNDISLIAELDSNCFKLVNTNEQVEALRCCSTCNKRKK